MPNVVEEAMYSTVLRGLRRHGVTSCSRWAEQYRVMGKPFPGMFSFKYHPWAREPHDSDAEYNCWQKAAQISASETMLNRTFYKMDIEGESVLYVLPSKNPDAMDFSASRFDVALELSPYLASMFSDVKNVGLKRAGSTSLFVRGSRARSGLKSLPAASIVFDELDEMDMENVQLALERTSGQMVKQIWKISTPTVDGFGINAEFLKSTGEHFFFNCPHCGRSTELTFPECLVITADDPNDQKINNSHLICKECKVKLDHETKYQWLAKGFWVPAYTDRDYRGFYINQLYSSTVTPAALATLAVQARSNPTAEQELYNSKLGLPRVVEGARLTDVELDSCVGTHRNGAAAPLSSYITMGVDVGKWFHYWIDSWYGVKNSKSSDINLSSQAKTVACGKVATIQEIDQLMLKYRPFMCVMDANPERRVAMEFANRFWGSVKLCFYGNNVNGKSIRETEDGNTLEVSVDRTSWLDLSLGRFRLGRNGIILPGDLPMEVRDQMKALIRRYETDKFGNPVGRYINTGADHYAHARNYAEIALAISRSVGVARDIGVTA